jgi:hypothetical protein
VTPHNASRRKLPSLDPASTRHKAPGGTTDSVDWRVRAPLFVPLSAILLALLTCPFPACCPSCRSCLPTSVRALPHPVLSPKCFYEPCIRNDHGVRRERWKEARDVGTWFLSSVAVREMRDSWPFGAALRGEAPNRLMLRRSWPFVVSDEEKAGGGARQVGTGKASESEPLMTCRNQAMASKPGPDHGRRDEPGGCPAYWPGGARHGGGASPVCGSRAERGKVRPDTAPAGVAGGGRERGEGRDPKPLSTVAGRAGGPARSSGEAPVMGAERRGGLTHG